MAGAAHDVREHNVREVLEEIYDFGPLGAEREELIENLELARATVLRAVSKIVRAAAVEGREPLVVQANDADGGRAAKLRVSRGAGFMLAIEFSHERLTVAVGDAFGRILERGDWKTDKVSVDRNAAGAMEEAARWARELLRARSAEDLIGVAIAVAAPVDEDGIVRSLDGAVPPSELVGVSTWVGLDLEERVREHLGEVLSISDGVPFMTGNDAVFAAVGEFEWQLAADRSELADHVHLKWSSGIGAGIIVDGFPITGAAGLGGEIGHTRVPYLAAADKPTVRCSRCGRFDCLENVSSYSSMKRDLGLSSLTRAEFEWDERGRARIGHVAHYVGQILGPVVNVLNPELVTIGGPSITLNHLIEPAVGMGLRETAIGSAAGDVTVEIAKPHWEDVGDPVGRLAVVSGGMAVLAEEAAVDYLYDRLFPEDAQTDAGRIAKTA